jgi:hypothetical protein
MFSLVPVKGLYAQNRYRVNSSQFIVRSRAFGTGKEDNDGSNRVLTGPLIEHGIRHSQPIPL